ncbi:MAG: hypothetical protein DPW14_04475 [Planctomycetes bacterium]|nr:hypothetical protein [Planctomycetota bacterium]
MHDAEPMEELSPHVVLFADILGYKQLVEDATGESAFYAHVRDALALGVSVFQKAKAEWEGPAIIRTFTDNIVVAWPIQATDDEEALGFTVLQAARLQFEMALRGYFIRGGLEVGKFHADENFLYGPAFIDAYKLESTKAIYPRIVLGPHATELAKIHQCYWSEPWTAPAATEYLYDQDNFAFIDYLAASAGQEFGPEGTNWTYVEDGRPWLLERLPQHRDAIEAALDRNEKSSDDAKKKQTIQQKLSWAARYHNFTVDRWFADSPQLKVGAFGTAGRFSEFIHLRLWRGQEASEPVRTSLAEAAKIVQNRIPKDWLDS